ncbi:Gfo/Idh/MocA family protein [Chitinophaga pinensis]|uniref:Oxidoreductase domain protein n=1 Tax=Chitinophaga pinensis (strain ATCC 43595 / DSM 2588 / LMG 13176 / NBRC 15968 / NCIMB 11800 / UQM 2034) TaxID=485918 RepID=A0A979GWA1_CHIPD|nr:Gfo/Idh/MocA family oxidoreductase [Chitinophaga pinensis]ACU63963.1 oxidoreductase domain protein [Chitinophaga pinensis DSM 2588]
MKKQQFHRRNFLKTTVAAGVGLTLLNTPARLFADIKKEKVRVGLIGVGARGQGHLDLCLHRDDVDVVAICDPDTQWAIPKSRELITKAYGAKKKVAEYSNGPEDFHNLLKRDDIDAVIIATPWEWHTIQAIAAMKAGKTPAVEVCGASDIQECWNLVNTSEDTGVPVFGMENVCYRRDVMAVLNMVRQGLFGELTHLQGGYQHDLRKVKFNNGKQLYGGGVEFGEKAMSEAKWRTNHSVHRNGDLYPTHGLGPVANMININRGNRLLSLTSVATKSRGLHKYVVDNGGENHPNAKVEFKLGDIVTTLLRTNNGETIMLSHDTNSPRPYSLNFRVQGTNGLWMDDFDSIYVEGKSPYDEWEKAGSDKDPNSYMGKYDHPLWRRYTSSAAGAGHGGMDWFVINSFIESVKRGAPYALDVYDLATWYAITPLSEQSVAEGGNVQYIPDFTRGRWMNRKPIFALDDQY